MVILREVHDVWKSALTLYVQISTSCSYENAKKIYLGTMHHLYVLVSERRGVLGNDYFLYLKKISFFTNDHLL